MAALILAFLAGILTVAAPCTLPVLPVLLGASIGRNSTARPAFIALGFVMSFSVVALVLSNIIRTIGISEDTMRSVAICLLATFGLLMIWPRAFDTVSARALGWFEPAVPSAFSMRRDNASGFLLGTTLGLVWTPCAGPVLGSILTVIATAPDIRWAATLLIVYATGAALPMFAIAYCGQAVSGRVRSVARIARPMQQGLGILVIAFAAAMYFQYDTLITVWLSDFYPNGQIGL